MKGASNLRQYGVDRRHCGAPKLAVVGESIAPLVDAILETRKVDSAVRHDPVARVGRKALASTLEGFAIDVDQVDFIEVRREVVGVQVRTVAGPEYANRGGSTDRGEQAHDVLAMPAVALAVSVDVAIELDMVVGRTRLRLGSSSPAVCGRLVAAQAGEGTCEKGCRAEVADTLWRRGTTASLDGR